MADRLPIEHAHAKTAEVQQELEVASAELHLSNTALQRSLVGELPSVDTERALAQNEAIEEKVQEAAEDLQVVTQLLAQEVAQRKQLEIRLSREHGGT
jgi:hypothetical protein